MENGSNLTKSNNISDTELMAYAIEAAELATWDLDPATGNFHGNARLKNWFGLEAEADIPLETALGAISVKDRDRVARSIEAALLFENGGLYDVEYTIVHPLTGVERVVRAKGKASFNEQKIAYRFNGILQDITEEKKVLNELKEAEERTRLAVEAGEIGTYDIDLKTLEMVGSPRLNRIFNIEAAGFQTEYLSRVHPDDLELRKKAHEEALRTGRLTYEARIVWPDGQIRWFRVLGKVFRNSDGEPYRILGAAVDTTEQRFTLQQLENSEHRLEILADAMPQLVWIANPSGEVIYYNSRIKEYGTVNMKEGEVWKWGLMVHPEDLKETGDIWNNAVQSGELYETEHRIQMNSGEFRWHLSRALPESDEQGNILRWFGTATDIDALKRAEEEQKVFAAELERQVIERTQALHATNLELSRSNAELEEFAYAASHDLQEPLRKVRTFIGMLADKLESKDAFVVSLLNRVEASAERMGLLIHDVLNFSRLTKSSSDLKIVSLDHILKEVLNDYELLIEQKQAVVHVSPLPEMIGIPLQINQLFYNLVGNALKFSPRAMRPEISITAETPSSEELRELHPGADSEKYFRLRFSDNGIGFDQDYADHIFTLFKRLHSKDEFPGSGIGLALCRKIVQNHRGVIYARSAPGKGAEFTILLPAAG